MLFHSGDRVWFWNPESGCMDWMAPGEIGEFIYTSKPPVGRPARRPSKVDVLNDEMSGSAMTILTVLRTWRWENEERDPLLSFGFLVSCLVCGALKAR